jgi:acetyl esterase
VLGNLDTIDPTMRHLCNAGDCIVVSVDYRLAPEHPWPAAADDAYASLVWAAQNAPRFGGDATRLAVGGDSAGGNLAAVVAQMVRDRGGPSLRHQVLVYPVIDAAMDTVSYEENTTYLLNPRAMAWFWDLYCPEGVDRSDPYCAPIHSQDLAGLPSAHVITAEFDPLRDEGEAYGRALEAAGVPVCIERYDGHMHGFFNTPHALDDGRRAIESAGAELQRAFGSD